jgi:CDP-6-deoxy-D-xylo-4-hexulose-3-dehydrase
MIPLQKNTFRDDVEAKKALAEFILRTDRFSMGPVCREFEIAFAKKQGSKEAVLFNSGGSANLAMLQSLKNMGALKAGDKVGFSSITWSTNVMPIIQMGFRPIAVDCDPRTLNVMSQNLLDTLKTKDLKAFFTTNVLGMAGNLDVIRDICDERGIILLEDNCEALGTELPAGKTGTFGLAASFSFFVAHHMSTIEGGMVCTDDEDMAEMLRIVRANGWDRNLEPHQQTRLRTQHGVKSEFHSKYTFYHLAYNLRPTEITGFLGLHQLPYLDESTRKREENYEHLSRVIEANDDLLPLEKEHIKLHSSFSFAIVCKDGPTRDTYAQRFMDAGIEIRPMIAGNMQEQPFYAQYKDSDIKLPGADFLHHNSFYCGNYPELTDEDLETICGCLKK